MRVVGRQQTPIGPGVVQRQAPAPGQSVDLSGVFARLAECEKHIAALAQANNALVTENVKLKQVVGTALANYRAHFNGLVRTLKVAYTPDAIPVAPAPVQPARSVPSPRAAPASAQVVDAVAMPSESPAGPPQSAAQQVSQAADQLFYGNGDNAFYEGGEND